TKQSTELQGIKCKLQDLEAKSGRDSDEAFLIRLMFLHSIAEKDLYSCTDASEKPVLEQRLDKAERAIHDFLVKGMADHHIVARKGKAGLPMVTLSDGSRWSIPDSRHILGCRAAMHDFGGPSVNSGPILLTLPL